MTDSCCSESLWYDLSANQWNIIGEDIVDAEISRETACIILIGIIAPRMLEELRKGVDSLAQRDFERGHYSASRDCGRLLDLINEICGPCGGEEG